MPLKPEKRPDGDAPLPPTAPAPITVEFYRSALCPRCLLAGRALERLASSDPRLKVKTIEVTLHPRRAWQAGIRMVPALKIGGHLLAGVLLTERRIAAFLATAAHTDPAPPVAGSGF